MFFKANLPDLPGYLFLGITLLAAPLAIAETTDSGVTPKRQSELMYFIKHDCGSCHGMTLKGGLGPALLPASLAGKPKELLVTTILEGRKGTAMPPWNTMLSRNDAIWITDQLLNGSPEQTNLAKGSQK